MPRFLHSTDLPYSAEEVFTWHARPGALERLIPPWERIEVLSSGGIKENARTVLHLRRGPFKLRWVAVHRDVQPGRGFTDEQAEGPFAQWRHTHWVSHEGANRCRLEDTIDYALPLAPISERIVGGFVRRDLARMFRFRHRRTADDLARHAAYRGRPRLKIALTGSSGLIGQQLWSFLSTGGHQVLRLVRREAHPEAGEVSWEPAAETIDRERLEGIDAAVHLSGRSIAAWRWSPGIKREIRESRIASTRLLCETLARLKRRPRVLIAASAIGCYGDRGTEVLHEDSALGSGFLAELCREWEAATEPARAAGIRVVNLRIGVVLSAAGGALRRMLPPFRLGLGGVLGDGRQGFSWIVLDDLLGAVLHLLFDNSLAGPVNAVAPRPLTNREYTKTLGRVLRRPTPLPLPAPIIELMFGEMGRVLFLEGARVEPRRLEAASYRFTQPELEGALRHELGR